MTAVHRICFKINIKVLIKLNHKSLNGNILLYFVGCHWEQGQAIQKLCVLCKGPADGTLLLRGSHKFRNMRFQNRHWDAIPAKVQRCHTS